MGPSITTHKQKKRDSGITSDGGLQHAEQLLGLRDITDFSPSPDIVFVCIDLEVPRPGKFKQTPLVKEVGIAILDTRCLASSSVTTKSISTQQFSTSHASQDFYGCDVTNFKECVFAETMFVSQRNLPAAITKSLRIQDDTSPDPSSLRNIVTVGHSIDTDLRVIERLGVSGTEVSPVLAILDTHLIAQNLFGAHSPTPMTKFKLSDLLTELKCPFEKEELHNAGNDATYNLHALLMLVVRISEGREMDEIQRGNFECLKDMTKKELHEREHWEPTRNALGFYASEAPFEWDDQDLEEEEQTIANAFAGPKFSGPYEEPQGRLLGDDEDGGVSVKGKYPFRWYLSNCFEFG